MQHAHDTALINSHAVGKESAEASAGLEKQRRTLASRERSLLLRAMQETLSDFKTSPPLSWSTTHNSRPHLNLASASSFPSARGIFVCLWCTHDFPNPIQFDYKNKRRADLSFLVVMQHLRQLGVKKQSSRQLFFCGSWPNACLFILKWRNFLRQFGIRINSFCTLFYRYVAGLVQTTAVGLFVGQGKVKKWKDEKVKRWLTPFKGEKVKG